MRILEPSRGHGEFVVLLVEVAHIIRAVVGWLDHHRLVRLVVVVHHVLRLPKRWQLDVRLERNDRLLLLHDSWRLAVHVFGLVSDHVVL